MSFNPPQPQQFQPPGQFKPLNPAPTGPGQPQSFQPSQPSFQPVPTFQPAPQFKPIQNFQPTNQSNQPQQTTSVGQQPLQPMQPLNPQQQTSFQPPGQFKPQSFQPIQQQPPQQPQSTFQPNTNQPMNPNPTSQPQFKPIAPTFTSPQSFQPIQTPSQPIQPQSNPLPNNPSNTQFQPVPQFKPIAPTFQPQPINPPSTTTIPQNPSTTNSNTQFQPMNTFNAPKFGQPQQFQQPPTSTQQPPLQQPLQQQQNQQLPPQQGTLQPLKVNPNVFNPNQPQLPPQQQQQQQQQPQQNQQLPPTQSQLLSNAQQQLPPTQQQLNQPPQPHQQQPHILNNNMPMPQPLTMQSPQPQLPPQQHQQHHPQQHHQQHQQQQSLEPIIPPHVIKPSSLHLQSCCDVFPITQTLYTRSNVPQGVVITPFAQPSNNSQEQQIPLLHDFHGNVIRCEFCRAYINPYVHFRDRGVRWQCNFCQTSNNVPDFYLQQLDQQTGYRYDVLNRPELCSSIYEMTAPRDYNTRDPVPPAFIFVLNVSAQAIQTGYLTMFCEVVKNSLDTLIQLTTDPKLLDSYQQQIQQLQLNGQSITNVKIPTSRGRIAFITYDHNYHYYQFHQSFTFPQMHIGTSTPPIKLPVHESQLHCNIQENKTQIETFLNTLPLMFSQQNVIEPSQYGYIDPSIHDNCLATALEAAHTILEHVGGKVFCFTSQLPNIGTGKLPQRGDVVASRTLNMLQHNTNQSQNAQNAQNQQGQQQQPSIPSGNTSPELIDFLLSKDKNGNSCYDSLAFKFSRNHFSIDLFLLTPPNTKTTPPTSLDIATLTDLTRLTSGEMYYYPQYQLSSTLSTQLQQSNPTTFPTLLQQTIQDSFGNDLYNILTTPIAWEAVYRLRVAGDIMISDVYGNFSIRGQSLIMLPTIDQRKTLTFDFRPPDVPKNTATGNPNTRCVYIQGALLYTTAWGERRIRVLSHCYPTTQYQQEIYDKLHQNVITTLLIKQCVGLSIPQNSGGLSKGRQQMLTKMIGLLKSYKLSQQNGQDPNFSFSNPNSTVSLLPLLTLSFSKSLPMRDINDIHIDYRVYLLYKLLSLSTTQCQLFLSPQFFSLHTTLTLGFNPSNEADRIGLPSILPPTQSQQQQQPKQSQIISSPLQLPQSLPLSQQYLTSDGFYLINNGLYIFIYIGRNFELNQSSFVGSIFGLDPIDNTKLIMLPPPNPITTGINNTNVLLYKFYSILNSLRNITPSTSLINNIGYQNIIVIRESTYQGQLPTELISCFVEDPQANIMSAQQFNQLIMKP